MFTNMGSPEPERSRRQLGFPSTLPYTPGLGDRGLRVGKKVEMGAFDAGACDPVCMCVICKLYANKRFGDLTIMMYKL